MRLHPRSIPYRIAENSVQIGGTIIFGAVAGAGSDDFLDGVLIFLGFALLGALVVAGWQVAYHRRFDYELTADTFDIRSGVFSRRDREIPYRRVQNVDVRENIIQRLLGIAEVRLETAGGGQTEAKLEYVSHEEAERLQEEIGRRKRAETEDAETPSDTESDSLFAITPRELGILGIISMDLRLVPFVLVGLSVVGPAAINSFLPDIDHFFLLGPIVGLGTIIVLAIIGGIIAMLQYYGFELRSHGEEYRYERGLIQRYSGSIPVEKVQTISIRENVLARLLDYASLTIETAGYAPGQGSGARSQSAVPIADRDRVIELVQSIEPFSDMRFERPPKRARERYAVRYLLLALPVIAGAYAVTLLTDISGPWYVTALILPVVPLAAHLKWTNRGYYLSDDYVITRNGFWSRRITIVPNYRVQTVLSSRTIFQRRRRLASVVIDTAGSSSLMGDDAVAADIDADVADRLRKDVAGGLQTAISSQQSENPSTGQPSMAD